MIASRLIALLQVFEYEDPDDWAALTESTLDDLQAAGLLTKGGGDGVFEVTEKGRVFVAALERLPCPIQKWVIPDANQEGC
jgi:hypothetical protein